MRRHPELGMTWAIARPDDQADVAARLSITPRWQMWSDMQATMGLILVPHPSSVELGGPGTLRIVLGLPK